MKAKKGQFWYTDFLLALFILMIISTLFIVTIVDLNTREDTLQGLIEDGITISNSLMSEGYDVKEWKNGKGRIGIIKDSKVNRANLDEIDSLSQSDYETSQYLFGIRNNYAFYFEDKERNVDKLYGKVYDLDDLNNLGVENLIKFTRFVHYDNNIIPDGKGEIVKMIVLVWES